MADGSIAAEVYVAKFPFLRSTFTRFTYDGEAPGEEQVPCWKPGVDWQQWSEEGAEPFADGVGEVILTVISRHKPGAKYPERVFYTRQWRDPDGVVFGKRKLMMTTVKAFERKKLGFWLKSKFDVWLIDSETNEALDLS